MRELTKFERMSLYLQHEALLKLERIEDKLGCGSNTHSFDHGNMMDIYIDGFKYEYDEYFDDIVGETISEEVSRFVINILFAYQQFQTCFDTLSNDEKKELKDKDISVYFPGWDDHKTSQSKFSTYARYLDKKGSFTSLIASRWNSHGTERDYELILERYNEIIDSKRGENKFISTKKEIESILKR